MQSVQLLHARLCVYLLPVKKCLLRIFQILTYSLLHSLSGIHVTHTHTNTLKPIGLPCIWAQPTYARHSSALHGHPQTQSATHFVFLPLFFHPALSVDFRLFPNEVYHMLFQPHFFLRVSLDLKGSLKYFWCGEKRQQVAVMTLLWSSVITDVYEQSGTRGHAWWVHWSVPMATTSSVCGLWILHNATKLTSEHVTVASCAHWWSTVYFMCTS